MSTIDNYGELELPEEKTTIEVVEDPVKIIIATYDIFKKIVSPKILEYERTHFNVWPFFWWTVADFVEEIYGDAEKLFRGKEQISLTQEHLREINKYISQKAVVCDGTALFFSALHNDTPLKVLAIDEYLDLEIFGYKLKKDKTLVLGEKVHAKFLGYSCDGNTINKGKIGSQGEWARIGLHINQGTLEVRGWAPVTSLSNALFVNAGGLLCNPTGLCYLNCDYLISKGSFSRTTYDLKEPKTKLQQAFQEIEFIKTTKDIYNLAEKINIFDFEAYERKLNEIFDENEHNR